MAVTDFLSTRPKGWRRWTFAAASVVVHIALIAALITATETGPTPTAAAERPEEVTYVDIATVPPPPPPPAAAQTQPEPQQQPVQQQPVRQPTPRPRPRTQTPPRAVDIIEPELDSLPPEPLGDIPPAAPIQAPIRTGPVAPVTGRQAGGQEGGVQGGQEGGVPGGQAGGGGVDPSGTYVAAVVDRPAELTNRRELARILQRLYPPVLRDARIGGRVVVQFVVAPSGRVDMSSVKIMSSTHDGFEGPTREAIREFRFRPARMGDIEVRMLTQMPIVWEVAN